MGRSLSALFVKTDDLEKFRRSFAEVLQNHGSAREGFDFYEMRHGWIGVTWDAFPDMETIAAALSLRLSYDVLLLWTNDSSSWHYQLYRNGEMISHFYQLGSEEASLDELGEFDPNDPATFANVEALVTFVPSMEEKDWGPQFEAIEPLLQEAVTIEQFNQLLNQSCLEYPLGAEQNAELFLSWLGISKMFLEYSYSEMHELPDDDLEFYDCRRM